MTRSRFEFALEHTQPCDWRRFETLASGFLASELPELRTVADASGDAGRDAELFSPTGRPTILIQYSVTKDWKAKIRQTADRLRSVPPTNNTRVLVYVSNQAIGAKADPLRSSLNREHDLILDIRDRSWFTDRYLLDQTKERLAEEYSAVIADPILRTKNLLPDKGLALDALETRAAFVYLKLQWEDELSPKRSNEGLFRCPSTLCTPKYQLQYTTYSRSDEKIVSSYIPNTNPEAISRYVDQSLNRLNKKMVRHWQVVDEFCLTHEEKSRLANWLLDLEQSTSRLIDEIRSLIENYDGFSDTSHMYANDIRRILEEVLLKKRRAFCVIVSYRQN